MNLKIMTKGGLVLDESVYSVTLPCLSGELTALDGHDMLLSELIEGKVRFRKSKDGGESSFQELNIGSGCVEIRGGSILIFTSKVG